MRSTSAFDRKKKYFSVGHNKTSDLHISSQLPSNLYPISELIVDKSIKGTISCNNFRSHFDNTIYSRLLSPWLLLPKPKRLENEDTDLSPHIDGIASWREILGRGLPFSSVVFLI